MKRQLIGELSISEVVYASIISEYAPDAGVTINDEVYLPGIGGSGVGTSIVYYNRSTGELTYGDAPTGTSDVSVTNQGDNRVVTSTAVTDELNAEENMTFNGSTLTLLNAAGLDQYGRTIRLGGNLGSWTARTDATNKSGAIVAPHYLNAEQDLWLIGFTTLAANNTIAIGGSSTLNNAATLISFYLANDNITTQGTNIANISTSGLSIDTIFERTSGVGVTVEGALLKDNSIFLTNAGGLDQYGERILLGSNTASGYTTRPDGATKAGIIAIPHYTNSEEPLLNISGLSAATTNTVWIGGGNGSYNAATTIDFRAAANSTTVIGTQVGKFDINGFHVNTIGELTAETGVTINDEVYLPGIGGSGVGTSIVFYNRSTGELTYGDAPTGTSDVSVTNQGDNRVVTATGVTDVLNAEANMTFDGNLNLLGGAELDQYGSRIVVGGNINTWTARTDATTKSGAIVGPHYTNSEEPFQAINIFSGSVNNTLYIGGGSSLYNTATKLYFYSASDKTTVSGTVIASIDINGFHTDTISEYNSGVGVTINDEVYLPTIGGTGTGTSMIYYNRSTGELTYGDAPAGTTVSFGTVGQIPYTNSGGDDFDYSANFTYDGNLHLLNAGGLDQYGPIIILGADNGTWTARTDSTWKSGGIVTPHYDNDEEAMQLILGSSSSSANSIIIGGSNAAYNAATEIQFYTAANTTTLTGTLTAEITPTNLNLYNGAELDQIGHSITVGASIAGGYTVRTNETAKRGKIVVPHYLNAEEDLLVILGITSIDSSAIAIGGGSATQNAALRTSFYSAANDVTLNGTEIARIDINGFHVNTISELTTDAGVTIEGTRLEDNGIYLYEGASQMLGISILAGDPAFQAGIGYGLRFSVDNGQQYTFGPTTDANSTVTLRAPAASYTSVIRMLAATGGGVLFRVDEDGSNYMPALNGTGTGTSMVYYNRTTGELTYADSPAGGVTLGTDTQIPYMNGSTDFQYSSNLVFNGTTLDVGTALKVNTITEHTTDSGVTIEGVAIENGWITLAVDDGIYFGSTDTRIIEGGFNAIQIIQGGYINAVFPGTGVTLGPSMHLYGWASKTNDLGDASLYLRNAYLDRVYIDQAAVYIDVTGSGATLDMTFTSTLSGTVNLNDLIGGGGGGVTSVAQGAGMSFTTITDSGNVAMGTPSTLTLATTNSAAGTTHTHALSIANVSSGAAGLAPAHGGVGSSYYLNAGGTWTIPPAGTVTSIAAGSGMNFTTITSSGSVTMGTPSSLTLATTNSASGTTHTHALSIANFTSTTAGLVPLSGGGTTNYLRADGTWADPGAGGGGDVSWGTETGLQPIVYGAKNGDIDSESNFSYNPDTNTLLLNGNASILGSGINFSGLAIDNAETYVVAIDPTTGLLSRRSVTSISTSPYNFVNGITESGGNVNLGNTNLSDSVSFGGVSGTYSFYFNSMSEFSASVFDQIRLTALGGLDYVRIDLTGGTDGTNPSIDLYLNVDDTPNPDEKKGVHIGTDTGILIFDAVDNCGMRYGGDFSTAGGVVGNRWIPDKEYVDGVSDRRLKDGIVVYTEPVIEKIQRLLTYIYHLKKDPTKTLRYGLMADEVEKEFPYAVQEMDEGFQSVRYKDLVPILMEAIKELKGEFDDFKSSIKKA